MGSKPLAALYVAVILALSVAAWADGCQTAYGSQKLPGGDHGGVDTPAPNCYTDIRCDTPYTVRATIDCRNDRCVDGFCADPLTHGWCTGGNSNWTMNRWQTNQFTFNCFFIGFGDVCTNLPYHTVNNWSCDPNPPPQTASCYQTWYNEADESCYY